MGDKELGKTALVRRFTSGHFKEVNNKNCVKIDTYGFFADTSSCDACTKPENTLRRTKKNQICDF